jgi:pimeloyl-ACP methyl ester carboxylesterase
MVEKTIELTHGSIPYLTGGTGPVFLFFHGATTTPNGYIELLDKLTSHFQVIAPTLPGHGNAFSINPNWSFTDYINTCRKVIQRLKINPQIISGHSFGGAIALSLANEYPQTKIVVFDPVGLPSSLTAKAYVLYLIDEGRRLIAMRPDLEKIIETTKATSTLFYTVMKHGGELNWFTKHVPSLDLTDSLKLIQNPVYLFWGGQDEISPLGLGKQMHKLIKNSHLFVYPKYGHGYPVIDTEEVFQKILSLGL